MKSFLQSNEWLNFQESVGRKTWHFDDGKISANIIRHNLPFGRCYLYIPQGPEMKLDNIVSGLKNELQSFINYLVDLAKKEKAIFVKVEPLKGSVMELLYSAGFKKSSKEIQPRKTIIVDLNKTEEELLAGMHHKTRYNIHVAERYGLKFTKGDNESFWKLLKHTAKNNNFSTHPKDYYEKLCSVPGLKTDILFVEHEGVPIAGAITLSHGDTVYYLHGAMDRDSKYKPMMAPYLLHWEIIKRFKVSGFKFYDFWGIDANKWPGVTRFKLGWGGREVSYPGSFDLPVAKLWYLAYKVFRRIR